MFRTNSEVLSVPSIILTTVWSCVYNLTRPVHRYRCDRNGREHWPIGALSDFTWLSALALSTLQILLICASGYIYGSGYVRLVRSCFIFSFMLIYSWEHRQYLSSLSQYIFCTSLWLKIRMLFPSHQNSEKHRTCLVTSWPSYLNIDIFDLVSCIASEYLWSFIGPFKLLVSSILIGSSYTLNIDIALTSRHQSRHWSIVNLSFT